MSLQKVREQNSAIGDRTISPKPKVIIRDLVEEYKIANRKIVSNRSIYN